jgi:hypothetical protein
MHATVSKSASDFAMRREATAQRVMRGDELHRFAHITRHGLLSPVNWISFADIQHLAANAFNHRFVTDVTEHVSNPAG